MNNQGKVIPIKKEYKKVAQLQQEWIIEYERQRKADFEAIISNIIGIGSLISIIFILGNFINQ